MPENKQAEIKGGATLWARQTIESEIFTNKPHIWFKIWFYLVNRVSHKDTKKYKRGETFIYPIWINEATGASPDQIKKALAFLRSKSMISTRRSTRGIWLKVLNYSHYQRLDNYYYGVKAPDKALEKHQRSTREAPRYNKNDKNDKKRENTPTQKLTPKAIMVINIESWKTNGKEYQDLIQELKDKGARDVDIEVNKFFNYWTEPNKTDTKQRWELQQTFELRRRLSNWINKKFINK